ncbi:MAG: hypothetical protein HY906_14160 [Deltaproteobacteria bacterium]|nr:hypothetical protein [Deltaproteobacteria bacterium]
MVERDDGFITVDNERLRWFHPALVARGDGPGCVRACRATVDEAPSRDSGGRMRTQFADLATSALHFTRGIPRDALALDLAYVEGRRVLALGSVDEGLLVSLEANGAKVVRAGGTEEAVALMAFQPFDVLVVDPEAPDGISFVKAVKMGAALLGVPAEQLRRAAQQHEYAPVILLPFPDEDEYAVLILPPEVAYLEKIGRLPLVNAIMHLDVRRLINKMPPVA